MSSFASLARLGMLAIACGVLVLTPGRQGIALADMPGEPPLLDGTPVMPLPVPPPLLDGTPVLPLPPAPPLTVPVPPAPDCLPKDPPPPVVKVNVRVPACSAPGKAIEYHICVENCSTAEAHHVLLKNPLPANAKFVRADPEPTKVGPELQWDLGTVGGGACREVVLVLQPTNAEDVKNCTRVQFEHGQCVTTRQAGHAPALPVPPGAAPPGVMPPAVSEVPVTPKTKEPPVVAPRLSLTVEGHKRQYVNLPSHYFLTVTNTGKTRATNVLASCVIPGDLKFERAAPNYTYVAGQVAWVVGDLDPGAQQTLELVLRAQAEGRTCIRPVVRADGGVSLQGEACTDFVGVSALHVGVSDRIDPVVVGGRTSYPIVIRNQGSAAVTNLKVKALIPPALQLVDVKGPTGYTVSDRTPEGQWVEMAALGKLAAMASEVYEVYVEARQAAATRLHVQVTADQLERGPVIEEESTTLFQDDPIVSVRPLSRPKDK
jgi:uncharacterized repeat protein (TIGR01451 family)